MINGMIRVNSILGQKIKEFQVVDLLSNSELPKGVYFISIEKEGISMTKKLIVN